MTVEVDGEVRRRARVHAALADPASGAALPAEEAHFSHRRHRESGQREPAAVEGAGP